MNRGLSIATFVLAAASAATVCTPRASAQEPAPRADGVMLTPAPQAAQPPASANATGLYRLDAASAYQRGCFPPCLCAMMVQGATSGTFRLDPTTGPEPSYQYFTVSEVNWKIVHSGLPAGTWIRATGFGTFRIERTGTLPVVPRQQMRLTLIFDDGTSATLDSGLVNAGAIFPAIDTRISINGGFCQDTVIRVAGRPLTPTQVLPYGLIGSQYAEGCFPPCACPLLQRATLGGFGLVPLPSASGNAPMDFAVVNANWSIVPLNPSPGQTPSVTLTRGFGLYTIVQPAPTAATTHRLQMDVTFVPAPNPSAPPPTPVTRRFDSGLTPMTNAYPFPRIFIDMSENGFACVDRAFFIRANPVRPAARGVGGGVD